MGEFARQGVFDNIEGICKIHFVRKSLEEGKVECLICKEKITCTDQMVRKHMVRRHPDHPVRPNSKVFEWVCELLDCGLNISQVSRALKTKMIPSLMSISPAR